MQENTTLLTYMNYNYSASCEEVKIPDLLGKKTETENDKIIKMYSDWKIL